MSKRRSTKSAKAVEGKQASPSKKKKTTEDGGKDDDEVAKTNMILERGMIYFFYRPKVMLDHAESIDDVQRFYIVLSPFALRDEASGKLLSKTNLKKRLLVMSRKRLPAAARHERCWCFVDHVDDTVEELHKVLEAKDYHTKTRGDRHIGGCVPAGEGMYEIILHGPKETTALAYVLEIPHAPGELQRAFHIQKEEAFVIQVKNPLISSNRFGERAIGLSPSSKAKFPKELQDNFKGIRVTARRFAPVNPTSYLDYVHAEFVMVGMADDLSKEFGAIGQELEQLEQQDEEATEKSLKGHIEDKVYKELDIHDQTEHPPDGLAGHWPTGSASHSSLSAQSSQSSEA
eukprot:gb/GEZN01006029.1/.p1 GENE.gb/GEZN01006029.1/~~gb/GEZN01006029.1/.p1  ORF type:complete len:345 (+),score=56.70 gb/GEZN01006029.1/:115-1149(+)